MDFDGHCIYSPDGKFISGDGYWDGNFMRHWKMVRLADGAEASCTAKSLSVAIGADVTVAVRSNVSPTRLPSSASASGAALVRAARRRADVM